MFVCTWHSTEGAQMNKGQRNPSGMRSWLKRNKIQIVWDKCSIRAMSLPATHGHMHPWHTSNSSSWCKPDALDAGRLQAASKQIVARVWTAKGGLQWCKTEQKIVEGEESAGVSSDTWANSSDLCLKRDLINHKHLQDKIRSLQNCKLAWKMPGSHVIMPNENAAQEK